MLDYSVAMRGRFYTDHVHTTIEANLSETVYLQLHGYTELVAILATTKLMQRIIGSQLQGVDGVASHPPPTL